MNRRHAAPGLPQDWFWHVLALIEMQVATRKCTLGCKQNGISAGSSTNRPNDVLEC